MKSPVKRLLMLGVVILGIGMGNRVQAATTNTSIGYTVGAITPATQINKQVSYFDIKVTTGQKQTLKAIITNTTDKPIFVKQQINNAYTTINGQLGYTYAGKQPQIDPSMKYPLNKILTLDASKIVMVPAHGTSMAQATLTKPLKDDFNGIILGGWYFEQVDAQGQQINNGQTGVSVAYSYVIGVQLHHGKPQQPKLTIGAIGYHKNINTPASRDNLTVKLSNPVAAILHIEKVKVQVKTRDEKVVFTKSYGPLSLAPNSSLIYDLTTQRQLAAGRYLIEITAHDKKIHGNKLRHLS